MTGREAQFLPIRLSRDCLGLHRFHARWAHASNFRLESYLGQALASWFFFSVILWHVRKYPFSIFFFFFKVKR